MKNNRRIICIISLLVLACWSIQAQEHIPCQGTTTAVLNIRSGPGTNYTRIGKLQYGTTVIVSEKINANWVQIKHEAQTGYVHSSYLKFSPLPENAKSKAVQKSSWNLWSILWDILCWGLGIYLGISLFLWLIKLLFTSYFLTASILTFLFRIVSIPFFFLNALQRYLAKPWILVLKYNRYSDRTNEILRIALWFLQIPLYITLFPIRLINAIYFNLLVQCNFEMFNYIKEVFFQSDENEGYNNTFRWIIKLPWRIIKYPLWHGSLTIIESIIWTIADTFIPALTLFHGTSPEAADCIVASPGRGKWRCGHVGIWHVGTGNYAGNGIYFAPSRSTALHYSDGSLIICRVTLGSTLDLGIAPRYVYRACGHPNALIATKWGLDNGYTTGEWWRPDEGWWEYCMYDWQNRYNFSWRIRPLYVINLETGNIQRIHGGMCHWLFRILVIDDLMESL